MCSLLKLQNECRLDWLAGWLVGGGPQGLRPRTREVGCIFAAARGAQHPGFLHFVLPQAEAAGPFLIQCGLHCRRLAACMLADAEEKSSRCLTGMTGMTGAFILRWSNGTRTGVPRGWPVRHLLRVVTHWPSPWYASTVPLDRYRHCYSTVLYSYCTVLVLVPPMLTN